MTPAQLHATIREMTDSELAELAEVVSYEQHTRLQSRKFDEAHDHAKKLHEALLGWRYDNRTDK